MIAASPLKYRTAVQSLLRSRPRLLFWAGLLTIVLFGLALAAVSVGRSLRIDEPLTANMMAEPLFQMLAERMRTSIRPVYFMLARLWTELFGESEIALRSISMLFFGLTIVTVGVTAKRIAGMPAGLIAALLVATSTGMGLVQAATARPYALLGLEAALAILLWVQLVPLPLLTGEPHSRTRPLWQTAGLVALLILLNIVGLLTHTIFAFFVAAYIGVTILVSWRWFLLLSVGGAVSLGTFLLLRGPILFGVMEGPSLDWMPVPDLGDLKAAFDSLWGTRKTLIILAYVAGLLIVRFRQSLGVLWSRAFLTSAGILVLTSLVPFVFSQYKVVFNPERIPIMFLPPAALALAIFLGRVGWRPLTLLVMALVALGSVNTAVRTFGEVNQPSARESVQYVVEQAQCGDTLVLGGLSYAEVTYYLRRFDAPGCLQIETFPQDTADHPGWMDVVGLLDRRADLVTEARSTVARLADQTEGQVWLFYNSADGPVITTYGAEVTEIFKAEIDQALTLEQELNFRGSYFNHILVYTPRTR
jgi:hypothetical protein